MAGALVTHPTLDTGGVTFPVAFTDLYGNGYALGFLYTVANTAGTQIDPASSQDIALVRTTLGSPLQANGYVNIKGNTAVMMTGTTGIDNSFNKPSIPNVGANFSASGPYASYAYVGSVSANPNRNNIDIENTSGNTVVIVRDDGTATSGAAPSNASLIPLGGGSSAGSQGGSWSSTTFKGRIQIYAPSSSAFVSVFQD